MKRLITFVLFATILLLGIVGCDVNTSVIATPTTKEPLEPMVGDIFTNPVTESTQMQMEQPSRVELEKQEFEKSMRSVQRMSFGLRGGFEGEPGEPDWYVYSGGEMEVSLSFLTEGAADIGVGVYIFIDGQPQPYRTEDGEYRYMHTFYPPDGERITETVYLVPVTGQTGEILEIVATCIGWPDYFLDMAPKTLQHTSCMTGHGGVIRFEADSPIQTLPSVSNHVLSWSVEQEDLSGSEIDGWSPVNLRSEIESHLYINEVRDSGNIWGYSGTQPLTLQYEIWGGTLGQYGLVFFVDNEPVLLDGKPWIPIQLENGKKTVVEVQLDLSGYDGSSVVYALLIGRNYFAEGIGNGANSIFNETGTFYICNATSHDNLMGWDE